MPNAASMAIHFASAMSAPSTAVLLPARGDFGPANSPMSSIRECSAMPTCISLGVAVPPVRGLQRSRSAGGRYRSANQAGWRAGRVAHVRSRSSPDVQQRMAPMRIVEGSRFSAHSGHRPPDRWRSAALFASECHFRKHDALRRTMVPAHKGFQIGHRTRQCRCETVRTSAAADGSRTRK